MIRRMIVNDFSVLTILALFTIGMVVLSAALYCLSRRYPMLQIKFINHSVPLFNILVNGTTMLIAFTIVILWQSYMAAASSVSDESGALVKISMISRSLPANEAVTINQGVRAYTDSVVKTEFGLMQQGQSNPATVTALDNLYMTVGKHMLINNQYVVFYREILDNLNSVDQDRYARLQKVDPLIPPFLMAVIVALILILVVTTAFMSEVDTRSHNILMFFTSISLGMYLAIVITFDLPFAGDFSVGSGAFDKVYAALDKAK